jgi:hypothetical protein
MRNDAPVCKRCCSEMDRIPRGVIMKALFFWLPFKRYCCFSCLSKKYILDFKKRR